MDDQEVVLGQGFTLDCKATGLPKPDVVWKKEGVVVDGQQVRACVRVCVCVCLRVCVRA